MHAPINTIIIIIIIIILQSQSSQILIYMYLMTKGFYSPVNHTGSPQCFLQVKISYKLNTIQNMQIIIYTNVKHINIPVIWKLVPSILLSYKKWLIKLGDAGTIDCFGLAFQHQIIKKLLKKEWSKTIANKKYYVNA